MSGFGRQQGKSELYGADEFQINLRRKVQLQIAVNEEFVEPTIQAIMNGGKTGDSGAIGDGKIFVLPMDDCVRIRTGNEAPMQFSKWHECILPIDICHAWVEWDLLRIRN